MNASARHPLRPILPIVIASLLAVGQLTAQEGSTSVGGYGELHYNEPDGPARGKLDFHRFVVYLAHSFNDRLSFNSEVELEHTKLEAGEEDGGEIAIEQAYLDWQFAGSTGLRAGIILIPMGIINEKHEPATFHGVERPNVDRNVIPSTWREAGIGLFGRLSDDLRYQAYVVAGLDAEGFNGSSAIRGGRQEGFESDPSNPSVTGRLSYQGSAGLTLGASAFAGNTTSDQAALGKGTLTMFSGDAQYGAGNFAGRAAGAYGSIADADRINTEYGNDVADSFYGFYVEGAYNVLPHFDASVETECWLFTRYEKYNTHASVTDITAVPAYDRDEITVGLTLKPSYNVAFKMDYQFLNNAADTDAKLLNFGIGYQF